MASSFENIFRPLAYFPEGICEDYFLESDVHSQKMEAYMEEIDPLKEQVRAMLVDISTNHKDKMDLINIVDRLGVCYYFEKEINDQLEGIFQAYNYDNTYDLYSVSVHFRVFRQHGHKMSCDVFNKFKDNNDKLQDNLKVDVKGILSLYEAAHLGMWNEDFMDEALDLTTDILHSIASESNMDDQRLYNQVVHATKQPLHKGIKRPESRHFITFYEEDESRNETLLRLAKIDFNMIQLLHRQELNQIVKWWNELNVKTQLPHVRNRSLECHYWAIAMQFEPWYARARLFVSKVLTILTILDDTFDAYGIIDELNLLMEAFERWDKNTIDELPIKMKLVFNHVFHLFDEFKEEMVIEERGYAARYAKASILDIVRCYHTEAKWANQRYIPSFEEYMSKAARITSGSQTIIISFMLGMKANVANEKEFEWVINPVPRVIRALEVIGRLMNDIISHEDEQNRGLHVASAIECYMHEHGASKDEAIRVLQQMVKDAWKDMNEELVKPIPVPLHVFELPINLARSFYGYYKETNGYTYSEKVMKNDVILVYAKAFNV